MRSFFIFMFLRAVGFPGWIARLLVLGVMLFGAAQSFANGVLVGRVVGVADGDTITVLDASKRQHRVRLQGIDAPESRQAFGSVARRGLSDMVAGKSVQVHWDQQDRYGRILGVVWISNRDVNLAMVRSGLAWHYKYYERDQRPVDRVAYAQAENAARAAGLGLWRDANPTAPWGFRRAGKPRPE